MSNISNEFKELVKYLKQLGSDFDFPLYITLDKVTGEVKKSDKNLKAFGAVELYNKLGDVEKNALKASWRETNQLRDDLLSYAKYEGGVNKHVLTSNLYDLSRDYASKLKKFDAVKQRTEKKNAVDSAKQKLLDSLKREDVVRAMSKIREQMEPHIVKSENEIRDKVVAIAEKVRKDFQNDVMQKFNLKELPVSLYSNVKLANGEVKQMYELVIDSPFIDKYVDPQLSFGQRKRLKGNIDTFIFGKEAVLYNQMMDVFRKGEEFKVEVLFYRLFKTNPTLTNYELVKPYNGNEFTIQANNENGEKILIQTETILAGGYNIQRLHTRWLVSVKNTVTNKTEKFTIADKDKE